MVQEGSQIRKWLVNSPAVIVNFVLWLPESDGQWSSVCALPTAEVGRYKRLLLGSQTVCRRLICQIVLLQMMVLLLTGAKWQFNFKSAPDRCLVFQLGCCFRPSHFLSTHTLPIFSFNEFALWQIVSVIWRQQQEKGEKGRAHLTSGLLTVIIRTVAQDVNWGKLCEREAVCLAHGISARTAPMASKVTVKWLPPPSMPSSFYSLFKSVRAKTTAVAAIGTWQIFKY